MSKKIVHDDISHFHDYDIHVPTRTIYMGSVSIVDEKESGVDAHMVERVIKGLHILDNSATNGDKPITIIMNNPGGDWYHGMAIHNAIKTCRNYITIIAYGHAMSMGSIILQAADERIMTEDSSLMMHYGTESYNGHTKDFIVWAEEAKKTNRRMEEIYLERIKEKNPKFRPSDLKKMIIYDKILSAEEAVKLGLCDKILEGKAE
jgi:ATP-dependent Clp endopeptidase proteolytic subunit ClpP